MDKGDIRILFFVGIVIGIVIMGCMAGAGAFWEKPFEAEFHYGNCSSEHLMVLNERIKHFSQARELVINSLSLRFLDEFNSVKLQVSIKPDE